MLPRPHPSDYAPYYGRYIDLVPEGDLLELLASEHAATQRLLRAVPAEREGHRYAPDKWSIREVVGHVADSERLFAFRALHFARQDPAPLPSMEQEVWARGSNAGTRPLGELLDEWAAVRAATIAFCRSLDPTVCARRGIASGNSFTVGCLPWIILGHELHHRRRLVERYLS